MKNKIITIVFIFYILAFSIFGIILKDKSISLSERRKLAKFPEYKLDSGYVTDLEKYFLDHFPLRDDFRSIKANFNYKILRKLDNNKIYMNENGIFKSDYPTNSKSIDNFVLHIDKTSAFFPKSNIYVLVVPDKNYYLDDKNFLHIDYDAIYDRIKESYNLIDIRDVLDINDYYATDTHWRQEKLDKIVSVMSLKMGFVYQNGSYKENVFDEFYGVYYGEAAVKRKPDELVFLTNEKLEKLQVEYLENSSIKSIYNVEKLGGLDSYEVYLDGASSFIKITNDNSLTDRELIVFRDSFASSLIPLITDYYSKITVIDNRYISSDIYLNIIEKSNQDILFLYSTIFINNSFTLKG